MRIGVTFPQTEFGNDPVALRDYAQTSEGLGYTHFLAYDHVLSADTANRPGWSGAYHLAHPFHEVFVLLGYVAAVTARLAREDVHDREEPDAPSPGQRVADEIDPPLLVGPSGARSIND